MEIGEDIAGENSDPFKTDHIIIYFFGK